MTEEVKGSDLVPTAPAEINPTAEVDEVKLATKNLVDALQRLAKAKAAAAKDLSEDAHENIDQLVQEALSKASEKLQAGRGKLISAQLTVQEARTKAGEKLQNVSKDVGSLEDKLTKAARAAWDVLSAPNPKD
jgi:argininosuccinate lyase